MHSAIKEYVPVKNEDTKKQQSELKIKNHYKTETETKPNREIVSQHTINDLFRFVGNVFDGILRILAS